MTPSRYHVVRTLSVISPRTFFLLVIRFYRAKWHSTPSLAKTSHTVYHRSWLWRAITCRKMSIQLNVRALSLHGLIFHFIFIFLFLDSVATSAPRHHSCCWYVCYHCYTNICTLKHFVLSLQLDDARTRFFPSQVLVIFVSQQLLRTTSLSLNDIGLNMEWKGKIAGVPITTTAQHLKYILPWTTEYQTLTVGYFRFLLFSRPALRLWRFDTRDSTLGLRQCCPRF